MTRAEHNALHVVERRADEYVLCNSFGRDGERNQYDGDCASCWLGHRHTWEKHDASIRAARLARSEDGAPR